MKQYEDRDEMDLGGFTVHPIGKFIFQIQEGIATQAGTKDNPQGPRRTLILPLLSIGIIEGEPNTDKHELREFVTLISNEGKENIPSEEFITNCLKWNGHYAAFDQQFPGDHPFTEPNFINALKIKLPGCTFGATVSHEVWNNKTNARMNKPHKVTSAGVPPTPTGTPDNAASPAATPAANVAPDSQPEPW